MPQEHILVVEDQAIVATNIEGRLRKLGYTISGTASSGQEAIERALETKPDLVLMDIRLPGEIDGVTAAAEIHAHMDVPIIYLTSYADDDTLQRAKIAEPFGYILKPFETRDLHSTIEMALYKYKIEKTLQKRTELLDTLRRVGLELSTQHDLDTLQRSIVSHAIQLLQGTLGGFYLYRPEQNVLELEWSVAIDPALEPIGTILHRGEGLSGKVWKTGQPIFVDHYQTWEGRPPIFENHPYEAVIGVPVRWREEFLGVLYVMADTPRTFDGSDVELLTLFATQAAVALINTRLYQQVWAGNERLQTLSQRLVETQEAERRHIARELHDEIGQSLTGLKLVLDIVSMDLPRDVLADSLKEARTLVNELVDQVRNMSLELRPAMLDDLGLLQALLWHFDRYTAQTQIEVVFEHTELDEKRFGPQSETAAYRIIQEALTNVARHAKVKQVTVQLASNSDTLYIQIRDKGIGFDPDKALATRSTGGLLGMQERATLLEGQLCIESSPGKGTSLHAQLPLFQSSGGKNDGTALHSACR